MLNRELNSPAELYLGTSSANARAAGPRRFVNGHSAIRFAMEEAAPVSLRGALLHAGGRRLDGAAIRSIYRSDSRFSRVEPREASAVGWEEL